jgi:eukaryotic translation initiation factor 2C
MSGNPKGNKKVCHHSQDPGNIIANCPQGKGKGKAPPPTTGLPDRTGPPNQTPLTPTTGRLTGPIWVSDALTSDKGPKVYTEADFISFGIKRTEEQKSFSTVDLTFEHGLRINHGTNNHFNQERRIITNYVKITQKPKWVYVYKLYFVRERPDSEDDKVVKDRTEKAAIFEALKTLPDYVSLRDRKDYATDYDVIWATQPLFPDKLVGDEAVPAEALTFRVLHPFTGQQILWHSVEITWETRIDAQVNVQSFLGRQNADIDHFTRGINAFMTQHARNNATREGYETTAANKFFLTKLPHRADLDKPLNALQTLRGFALSLRPGNDDWYLNLHVGASPFMVKGNLLDLFNHLRKKDMELSPREVCNAFRDRKAKINDSKTSISRIISRVGTDQMRAAPNWSAFDAEVARLNRGIPVYVYSDLPQQPAPCKAINTTVEGFKAFRGLLSSMQTKNMHDFACKLPVYNKRYIEQDGFEMFGISTGQDAMAKFDVAVGKELLSIPARLLTPPQLHYRNKKPNPNEASWNLTGLHFFVPAALKRVVVMDLAPSTPGVNLSQLSRAFQKTLNDLGLTSATVVNGRIAKNAGDPAIPGETELLRYFKNLPAEDASAAALVVLKQHDYDLYASIKRVADLQLGRHAVCAIGSKMHDFRIGNGDQYLANVGMKFNLKGGGINHAVERSHLQALLHPESSSASAPCRTIIIGADVAHPTGSARPGCPSIAAVVGSVDDNYLHYPGSMRLQISKQEFIGDLRDMVKERLIDWAVKHQDTLPANMLMYRDGVSESQYESVRTGEIPQLQGAFNDAYEFFKGPGSAKINPPKFKLTFVVVGKRHNTRFFTDIETQDNSFLSDLKKNETYAHVYPDLQIEEDQEFQAKLGTNGKVIMRNGEVAKYTRMNHNIRPGFVVDKVITHPYSEDFFLQSHMPLQGTGRSAHYFVLTNQMRLDADKLQQVTHSLCYTYARATKGVSYCAPAYYADRLCDRGRAWLRDWLVGRASLNPNPKTETEAAETSDDFDARVLNHVNNGTHWRPLPPATQPQKYGALRRNPWHKNLDDIMFYL